MMQIHSVDHCNFSCKGCSHSSDIAPKKFFTFEDYKPHLEKLSEYTTAERIDVTGGEQDCDLRIWQDLINCKITDIFQPDIMYMEG